MGYETVCLSMERVLQAPWSVCLAMRSAVLRPTELKLGTGVEFGELGGTVNFSSRPERSQVIQRSNRPGMSYGYQIW